MSGVHIYRHAAQPATRFVDVVGGHRFWTRYHSRRLVRTSCCRQLRWAGNCVVQVYYDTVPFWCREGKGCKGHQERKYVRGAVLVREFLRGLSVVGLARKYGLSMRTVEKKLRTERTRRQPCEHRPTS